MKCKACGGSNEETFLFCMHCGNKVTKNQGQSVEIFRPKIIQFRCKKKNGFTFILKGRKKVLCTVRFLVGSDNIPKAVLQVTGPSRMDLDEFFEATSLMQSLVQIVREVTERTRSVWESEVESILTKNKMFN